MADDLKRRTFLKSSVAAVAGAGLVQTNLTGCTDASPNRNLSTDMNTKITLDNVVESLPLDESGFAILDQTASGLTLPGHGRILALRRHLPYWCEPQSVERVEDVSEDTMLLLWERDDAEAPFGAMVPLAAGKRRASIKGDPNGLSVAVEGLDDAPAEPIVAVGAGTNPRALVAELVARASSRLGTFKLRSEKPQPEWVDRLGWCTWNAFYHDINEDRVFEGLKRLHDQGVHPSLLILDDGWMQHTEQKLTHFVPDPAKFPNGLKPMIDRCKAEFGIKQFGVWHTLQGYWHGVHPDSELAQRYRVTTHSGNILDIENPADWLIEKTFSTVHPEDIGQFFDDWHGTLAESGVDMVKVDNQAGIMYFGGDETKGGYNRVDLAHAYRNALHASGGKHFGGEVLNCMSMNNTLTTAAFQGNTTRNSDDYFPARPHYQGRHIQTNAKNALLIDNFAVADWDMFQTQRTEAHMHAVSRAISGGPVYFADKPGEHDGELARTLAGEDGHVFRYNAGSGMPTNDRWFNEAREEDVLLKVQNTQRDADGKVLVGAVALFHCRWAGDDSIPKEDLEARKFPMPPNESPAITDHWSPRDIDGLEGDRFAAWSPVSQTLTILDADAKQACTLKGDQAELFHLTPIEDGFAPLGLLDRLNGGAAIAERKDRECMVSGAGRFGAFVASAPTRVAIDGQDIAFEYDADRQLLTAELQGTGPHKVTIEL